MRVKHVPQASGPEAYHTSRRCEYCYIRANLVEGSFRLEIVQHSGSFLFKDLTKRESIGNAVRPGKAGQRELEVAMPS